MANKSQRKRIIAAASADGTLHTLAYYIQMRLPLALRPRPDAEYLAATFPPGFVPIVPLAPDPEIAADYAYILEQLMWEANKQRGILFAYELTTFDLLEQAGHAYYTWGEEISHRPIDWVCPICGQIEQVFAGNKGQCCLRPPRRKAPPKPCYKIPANAQRIGLHWWGGGEAHADEQWCQVRNASPFAEEQE